jgi:hypothetical protein
MPLKSKLKALTTDTPVKIKLSDTVSEAALYVKSDNTIYVSKGLDGETLFSNIAYELIRAQNATGNPEVDVFVSDCAVNIVCRRFGIAPHSVGIPECIADMDLQEQRSVLNTVHRNANEIVERVDVNLNLERHQQRNQPVR